MLPDGLRYASAHGGEDATFLDGFYKSIWDKTYRLDSLRGPTSPKPRLPRSGSRNRAPLAATSRAEGMGPTLRMDPHNQSKIGQEGWD